MHRSIKSIPLIEELKKKKKLGFSPKRKDSLLNKCSGKTGYLHAEK
jgi:hypothetical protein